MALGGTAASEGIKFLYGQASELLKAWRERRSQGQREEELPAELPVPIIDSTVLDARPTQRMADATVLARENGSLVKLIGALSPYAQDLADIDLADSELAEQAGRLRALLEAAYHQRFTFQGEDRDPTGSRVTVRQVLGIVEGQVLGADAAVGPSGYVDVEQYVDTVKGDGSLTGFTGRVGESVLRESDRDTLAGPEADISLNNSPGVSAFGQVRGMGADWLRRLWAIEIG